jgi:hypothetical protein
MQRLTAALIRLLLTLDLLVLVEAAQQALVLMSLRLHPQKEATEVGLLCIMELIMAVVAVVLLLLQVFMERLRKAEAAALRLQIAVETALLVQPRHKHKLV